MDQKPSVGAEIDEDKAFVVGVWTVGVIVLVLLVLFVGFAVGRNNNSKEQSTQSASSSAKVMGEKETTKTNSAADKQANVSDSQPSKTATSQVNDVSQLERPLTDDETVAKAKTIAGSQIHTVAAGESLYGIGQKYNIDWHKIAEVNNLSEPYSLHTGQKLIIAP